MPEATKMATKPIPEGFHTVTPYLIADDAAGLLDFMKKAFGATEDHKPVMRPDGTMMHATMRIGDGRVMVGGGSTNIKAMPAMVYLYVPDVDAVHAAAVKAGGTSVCDPMDMFYGDRSGGVTDPFGNHWWIGTHIEDVAQDELEKRAAAMFKKE